MRNFIEDLYPVEWAGGQAVVTLPEHIGISNAGQVREELLSIINRGATTLIADLTATVSCDQSGAEAVFRAWQRAAASGTELRLVITAQIVGRMLRLVGLNRMVSVYPSLDAATAARLPTAAGVRAEGVPSRGSEDMTAAQPADLRILDAVITGLFQVELGLQAALDLPADPARRRTEEALDDLTGVIGEIRAIVSAARGQHLRQVPPGGDGAKAGEPGGRALGSSLSASMMMRAAAPVGGSGTDPDGTGDHQAPDPAAKASRGS